MKFFNNALFRKIAIDLGSCRAELELPDLLTSPVIEADGSRIEILSVIDDEVTLLENDKQITLNKTSNKYASKEDKLKITVSYAKKVKQFEKYRSMSHDDLLSIYDNAEDALEKEQIAFLIYQFNSAEALALVTLACVENDKERAVKYADKAAELGYYRGYFYIGREYFNADKTEDALKWLLMFENDEKRTSLSENLIDRYYEMLSSSYYTLDNYMKCAYYSYLGIKRGLSLCWYMMYFVHQSKNYLPLCKPFMKYCLEQVSPEEFDTSEELKQYEGIVSQKPDYSFLDELKDRIHEDINPHDIYMEAVKCRQRETRNVKMAEELLNEACELYHMPAFSTYALALNGDEEHDEPVCDEEGYLLSFKSNSKKAFEILVKGSDIGDFDCMLALFAFASDGSLHSCISPEKVHGYYERFMELYSDKFTDPDDKDITEDIINAYRSSLSEFEEISEEKAEKTEEAKLNEGTVQSYLNKYYRYNKILKLRLDHILERIHDGKIKTVCDSFVPVRTKKELTMIELEEHASYYLTKEYNERMAYYYSYMGYAAGSEYCTYLMGLIYEMGVFVPNILAYSKFFYEKIHDSQAETMNYINAIEPKMIEFNHTEDFYEFDPVVAFLEGLKLISTDQNEMPSVIDMNDGLELIKDSACGGYAEAKYILGCLYFDVGQGDSRLWEKGQLLHLESNAYLAVKYFNEAIELGHENSMLVMAALHSYKGNSENKIQGKYDNDWCLHYWNKIYELYQYSFIKDLGLTLDSEQMLFDFYGIRFSNELAEYMGKHYAAFINTIIDSDCIDKLEVGNCLVALTVTRLKLMELFFCEKQSLIYPLIFGAAIKYYTEHEDYHNAYEMIRFAYKTGTAHKDIDIVAKRINANKYEIAYLKALEFPK